jgi:hypothetical protein
MDALVRDRDLGRMAEERENPGLAPSLKAQAEAGPLMPMVRRVNMDFP